MNWRGLRWIYSNSVLVFADEFEDDLRDSFDARIYISGISSMVSQLRLMHLRIFHFCTRSNNTRYHYDLPGFGDGAGRLLSESLVRWLSSEVPFSKEFFRVGRVKMSYSRDEIKKNKKFFQGYHANEVLKENDMMWGHEDCRAYFRTRFLFLAPRLSRIGELLRLQRGGGVACAPSHYHIAIYSNRSIHLYSTRHDSLKISCITPIMQLVQSTM